MFGATPVPLLILSCPVESSLVTCLTALLGGFSTPEVAFAQSVDLQLMLATLEGMLGRPVPLEIKQGLLQVLQRRLDNFYFSVGSLRGQIVRQECDLIYISIWEASFHDFVNPADARKC